MAYDISSGILSSTAVHFAENLPATSISNCTGNAWLHILVGATKIVDDVELTPNSTNTIRIRLAALLRNMVSQTFTIPLPFAQPALNQLTFKIAATAEATEFLRTMSTYIVAGGVNATVTTNWFRTNWLTAQPQEIETSWLAPQVLMWVTQLNSGDPLPKIKVYFRDEAPTEITPITAPSGDYKLRRLNVSLQAVIGYLTTAGGTQKSPIIAYDVYANGNGYTRAPQRYIVIDDEPFYHYFMFQNPLGGYDTLITKGQTTLLPTIDHTSLVNQDYDSELAADLKNVYEVNTGAIDTRAKAQQIIDFLRSPKKYEAVEGTLYEIVVDEDKTEHIFGVVNSHTFKYHYSNRTNLRTPARVSQAELGEYIQPKTLKR